MVCMDEFRGNNLLGTFAWSEEYVFVKSSVGYWQITHNNCLCCMHTFLLKLHIYFELNLKGWIWCYAIQRAKEKVWNVTIMWKCHDNTLQFSYLAAAFKEDKSQNAQPDGLWWATTAEDHVGFLFCHSRTESWDCSRHRLTKTGQLRTGKT